MPVLPFSEYRPDVSDYNGQTSRNIVNALPRGDGYGPQPNLGAVTSALPAPCRGAFLSRNADGSVNIFAGTSTDLYQLNNGSGIWTLVSRAGGYNPLSTNANWQFAQFNNYVFATQQNDVLQIWDTTASTLFANQAGSAPQAAYITVVNSFLVLCGIAANNVYRIQWSGLNDVSSSSSFTPGVNSSDYQDLGDGGLVRGASGGEYGVIFQDQCIRRLLYAPGTAYIFQIERIATEDGLYAPYSLIRAGNNVFWLSPSGFKVLPPGGVPTPIGRERVDRFFFADVDFSNPQLIIGSCDPADTHVRWAYKSQTNSALTCDKQIGYDWALDKWFSINGGGYAGVTYLASLAQPGITLEGVDAAYGLGTPVPVTSLTSGSSTVTAIWTKAAHGLAVGQGVTLTSTSTLPYGYLANTPYYVKSTSFTSGQFTLSAFGGFGANEGAGFTSTTTTTGAAGNINFAHQSLENLSIATLDSLSVTSLTKIGAVSTAGVFGFFNGPNLQATMETPEQSADAIGYGTYPSVPGYGGTRIYVRGFRAITDSTVVNGSVSYREGPALPYNYTAPSQSDIRGFVPLRMSTRYSRARVVIPQAAVWTFAAGIEANIAPEGLR